VILDQHEQQVESTRAELGGLPLDREQALGGIEIEAADPQPARRV
jgi:hypothetical protein